MAAANPSMGPWFNGPFAGNSNAYRMAQATVQIRKKLAIAVPEDAPTFWAAPATTLPQYAKPESTVTKADQRNHQRAGSINGGMTFPRIKGSSSLIQGKPTKLKKYKRPIQVMPVTR